MTLHIVVDRATHKLTLFRGGKAVKSWGVAVGSPQFPTPTGDFQIQSMQKNPTWTPPDSAWAKDAEVIPPGPDNPLGTRWMAIDGTVGIHGTNSPQSIGFSVSHGCIRMAIPDVEELYDLVAIGTRVTVQ
jgi:lipoprotein-anchoring transpeptidase ErfK/SrfK